MERPTSFAELLVCTFLFGLGPCVSPATAQEADPDPKGAILLASAEGLSVFKRDGVMEFGYFHTPLKDGKPAPVAWSDMIYDGHRLPGGNYVCSSHHFVRELAPDGRVVWEYRVQAPAELKTCTPLPNGDVMTVDAAQMELLQLTESGTRIARRIPVPTDKAASPHNRYNLLRRTDKGTFLLALRAEKAFVEVDADGKDLWRHAVPDLPVVAERLPGGNTLMSWRGGLLEVSASHETVWQLNTADIKEFPVVIFGGFHRFPNGNTLVANSDWHYRKPEETRVQLFEINARKEVLWRLEADAFAGKKPGSLEPRTGLVEHRIIGIDWISATPTPSP